VLIKRQPGDSPRTTKPNQEEIWANKVQGYKRTARIGIVNVPLVFRDMITLTNFVIRMSCRWMVWASTENTECL